MRAIHVHVHTDENLRCPELFEGMLDSIGNIGGYSYLGLHLHLA